MKLKSFNAKNLIILVVLILFLVIPYFVFAKDNGQAKKAAIDRLSEVSGQTYGDQMEESAVGEIVANFINGFLALIGVIFLCFMIYGGYLWLTAGGNEDNVKKAKAIIKNSIIGIIIIVAAYAVTYFVLEHILSSGTGKSPGGS